MGKKYNNFKAIDNFNNRFYYLFSTWQPLYQLWHREIKYKQKTGSSFTLQATVMGIANKTQSFLFVPFIVLMRLSCLQKGFTWLLSFLPVQKLASTIQLYCMFQHLLLWSLLRDSDNCPLVFCTCCSFQPLYGLLFFGL